MFGRKGMSRDGMWLVGHSALESRPAAVAVNLRTLVNLEPVAGNSKNATPSEKRDVRFVATKKAAKICGLGGSTVEVLQPPIVLDQGQLLQVQFQ